MTGHILEKLIGKRFRLIGSHPHTGQHGQIVRVGDTPFGKRPVMKLDDPQTAGVSECYVMEHKQVAREIKKGGLNGKDMGWFGNKTTR